MNIENKLANECVMPFPSDWAYTSFWIDTIIGQSFSAYFFFIPTQCEISRTYRLTLFEMIQRLSEILQAFAHVMIIYKHHQR